MTSGKVYLHLYIHSLTSSSCFPKMYVKLASSPSDILSLLLNNISAMFVLFEFSLCFLGKSQVRKAHIAQQFCCAYLQNIC
jgi:hypothetical protein